MLLLFVVLRPSIMQGIWVASGTQWRFHSVSAIRQATMHLAKWRLNARLCHVSSKTTPTSSSTTPIVPTAKQVLIVLIHSLVSVSGGSTIRHTGYDITNQPSHLIRQMFLTIRVQIINCNDLCTFTNAVKITQYIKCRMWGDLLTIWQLSRSVFDQVV